MQYTIGEFSKITGAGIHTLRYYEKEKLIAPRRNQANRRRYSEEDARRFAFIKRLKDIGVPIKEIRRYAALRDAGDFTMQERTQMLIGFRATLTEKINILLEHRDTLDEKIKFYQERAAAQSQKPPSASPRNASR